MGMKRVYAQMGGGRFMEDMQPRKRPHIGRDAPSVRASAPVATSPARRVLRAQRMPAEMEVEPAPLERKRPLPGSSEPGAKRARASGSVGAGVPPRRTRRAKDEAASRERARRTAPSSHPHAVAAAVAQAMQERVSAPPPPSHYRPQTRAFPQREPEPQPEQIEEIFIDNMQSEAPPNAPSVQAALLADGRCAVRIVRENGVVQGVIIDPPMMY